VLDTDTKRRIDTARDILVGKVPDPKSQVEQITIALIYKFMDDMDAEAEELGGRRSFFAGDYARYGWAKLMRSGLGGFETLNLYAEAIAQMPENVGIPPLFRDIFKNAYLPYRDPETLRSFLKVIDEFSYDHSERLGDAFEYLLSVLGSQGDAGQFRTPRHIIDFIVEIVDPKVTETILDPACGTAGFLISSYKHILRANTDSDGHSTLTPDDKERMARNLSGYDISPDMVRLSLVNLYLHDFNDPHVVEYDTLTSQDRWNEHADVILANPPFMSPKGGIRPHNRFSVQSKRSEVLFVDYMAEHLTPSGRAGIIVPEGITFQSQTSYTQLRRMLVESSLVAVLSLPAGVFNPYSGVKTSILILDKGLAHSAETIGFFRIENDGFGLGAQRRPIEKNDLPLVLEEVTEYLRRLRGHESMDTYQPTTGILVARRRILGDADHNLNADRYREAGPQTGAYPWRTVGSLITTVTPPAKIQKTAYGPTGRFPIIDQSQNAIAGWTDDVEAVVRPRKPLVIFGDHTCTVKLATTPFAQGADGIKILETSDVLEPRYLYHVLKVRPIESGGYQRHFARLREAEIPIPPLDVQRALIAEVESYERIVAGARAVVDNYDPRLLIDPEWPRVETREVAAIESGFAFPLDYQGQLDGEIPFLKVSDMNLPGNEREIVVWNNSVSRETLVQLRAKAFPGGTVIFPKIGAAIATNKKRILTRDSTYDNNVMGIVPDPDRLLPGFLHAYLLTVDLSVWASDAQPPSMRKTVVEAHVMPLPPLETQASIVAALNVEEGLIAANRELIRRFEEKIRLAIARIWGHDQRTHAEA